MDARQLNGALQGLSNGLGALAGYEAQREQFAMQERAAARRDAANKAFQVMLYNAKAAQDQSQFEATRAEHAADRDATADYRERTLAQDQQRLTLEGRHVEIAQQRADEATQKERTDKQAGVLGSRLTAAGKLVQFYTQQRDKEIEARVKGLGSNPDLMVDPAAMARAKDEIVRQVNAKYQPIIERRQSEYDRLNAKFGDLTGVQMGDAEEAAQLDTPEQSTPATPADAAPAIDDDSLPLPGATAQPGSASGVPGARRAPDGHWYVPDPQRPGKYLRVDG